MNEWLKIINKEGESILTKFYHDKKKYSFSFQILILKTMLELISNAMDNNPQCKLIICERSILSSRSVFAKMLYDDSYMNEIEYQIYESIFQKSSIFIPNKIVYLQASPTTCLTRINKRVREGENKIDLHYLEKCDKYHKLWFDSIVDSIEILNINMDSDKDTNNITNIWIKQILDFCKL